MQSKLRSGLIHPRYFVGCTLWMLVSALNVQGVEPESNGSWLAFRGNGSGAAVKAPAKLDPSQGGNLAWRREMVGRSVASPIIVGDVVITTSSYGLDERQIAVTAVKLESGEIAWEQSFLATGRPYCHPTSANAAPSPVSDGERIFAFFSSNDLVCLSLQGDLLWYRGLAYDYPKAGNDVGMASSPVVADGVVIVQVENQGDSFAAGIDAKTGENVWRIERPRRANWASPAVIKRGDGRTEVVVQSGENLQGLNPKSGEKVWEIAERCKTVPSATPAGSWLLAPAGELLAIDVSSATREPQISWRSNRVAPANASVIVSGDKLYALKGSVLVAANLKDGEMAWQQRIGGLGGTWATPLVAENRVYVFDQNGKGVIIEDEGSSAKQVGEFNLEEPVLGSPAAAHGRFVVRGVRTLFCFQ